MKILSAYFWWKWAWERSSVAFLQPFFYCFLITIFLFIIISRLLFNRHFTQKSAKHEKVTHELRFWSHWWQYRWQWYQLQKKLAPKKLITETWWRARGGGVGVLPSIICCYVCWIKAFKCTLTLCSCHKIENLPKCLQFSFLINIPHCRCTTVKIELFGNLEEISMKFQENFFARAKRTRGLLSRGFSHRHREGHHPA